MKHAMSGSPFFKLDKSRMRQHHNGDVTTKYEPILCGFMFGFFNVYKSILTFFGKSATNNTSVGSYGAERGNEGKPQPFRNERGCIR